MKIIKYESKYFNAVKETSIKTGMALSLQHKDFVEWYYNSNDNCCLTLLIKDDSIVASLGEEKLPFVYKGEKYKISFLSNYMSFEPGFGGFLFFNWLRENEYCGIFGGGQTTQDICRKSGWRFYSGFDVFVFNHQYKISNEEQMIKKIAKKLMNHQKIKKLQSLVNPRAIKNRSLTISEIKSATKQLVKLETRHNSSLLIDYDTNYLNWRYNTELKFVDYRIFIIKDGNDLIGYIITNEKPGKIFISNLFITEPHNFLDSMILLFSQFDQKQLLRSEIVLSTPNDKLKRQLKAIGFKGEERSFAIGSLKDKIPFGGDTSSWMINYGISDNDLRHPFIDRYKCR